VLGVLVSKMKEIRIKSKTFIENVEERLVGGPIVVEELLGGD